MGGVSKTGLLLVACAAFAAPAAAANRCVTKERKIVYTSESCESVGGKLQRQITEGISVVPAQPSAMPARKPSKTGEPVTAKPIVRNFRKSPQSPVISLCYDPSNARSDVRKVDVEKAIDEAAGLWNAGCNVRFDFTGACVTSTERNQRVIDYPVYWSDWDETMTDRDGRSFKNHAIAAASPYQGVALNRTIEKFPERYRRAIVHELGHIAGIGHSNDPYDLMFSGGTMAMPTNNDYDECNKAIAIRYGVKSE